MPFPRESVKELLEQAMPGAKIAVDDLTGTSDHYKVTLVSDIFVGKSLVQRHQLVNQALAKPLEGPIHALSIETYTEDQWTTKNK